MSFTVQHLEKSASHKGIVPQRRRTVEFLHRIGVPDLPPRVVPFDPGYDPITLEGHLEQSAHLMEALKISMACWMIADEAVTCRKVAAAAHHNVATVTGGGPFEIDRKSTRLNSSHIQKSRMPSSA